MAEKEYIERKSIVDSIRKDFDFYYQIPIYLIDRDVQNIINRVNRVVQEIPAADVAPVVHAEWIFDFELDGSNFYKCSVCGRQEVLLAKESTKEYFPYCHCGAKMDGGKHETD